MRLIHRHKRQVRVVWAAKAEAVGGVVSCRPFSTYIGEVGPVAASPPGPATPAILASLEQHPRGSSQIFRSCCSPAPQESTRTCSHPPSPYPVPRLPWNNPRQPRALALTHTLPSGQYLKLFKPSFHYNNEKKKN